MSTAPSHVSLTLNPTAEARTLRSATGEVHHVPGDWTLVPPGDAGLTRRVKAAGPSWTVVEKVGRRVFSRGVWAPTAAVAAIRAQLETERASPQYQKKRVADGERREREQSAYEVDFARAVRQFLRFAPRYADLEAALARKVTSHATPVGSGTVARTERISIERRAEAAVLAWMRHQTTSYDVTPIARVKGLRREIRRDLSRASRDLLELHWRLAAPHASQGCALCKTLADSSERAASLLDVAFEGASSALD